MIRACILSTPKPVATAILPIPQDTFTGLVLKRVRFTLYIPHSGDHKDVSDLPYSFQLSLNSMSYAAHALSTGEFHVQDPAFPALPQARVWDYTTLVAPTETLVTKTNQNKVFGALFYDLKRDSLLLSHTVLPAVLTVDMQVCDFKGNALSPQPNIDIEFELF